MTIPANTVTDGNANGEIRTDSAVTGSANSADFDAASLDHAFIARANYHQFQRGDSRTFERVRSRMVLWGLDGVGQVWVDGQAVELTPGAFVLNPWEHRIVYRADARHPMRVAGIHVVPHLAVGHHLAYGDVSHEVQHPLATVDWLRDVELPGLAAPLVGHFADHPIFAQLCAYVVDACARQPVPAAAELQRLGAQVLLEMTRVAATPGRIAGNLPPALVAVLRYMDEYLAEMLTLETLARQGGISVATLNRLFRRHLQSTPIGWLTARRLGRAAHLLATTRDPVTRIAADVGIADPRYFARLFQRVHGRSPTRHRRAAGLLGNPGDYSQEASGSRLNDPGESAS